MEDEDDILLAFDRLLEGDSSTTKQAETNAAALQKQPISTIKTTQEEVTASSNSSDVVLHTNEVEERKPTEVSLPEATSASWEAPIPSPRELESEREPSGKVGQQEARPLEKADEDGHGTNYEREFDDVNAADTSLQRAAEPGGLEDLLPISGSDREEKEREKDDLTVTASFDREKPELFAEKAEGIDNKEFDEILQPVEEVTTVSEAAGKEGLVAAMEPSEEPTDNGESLPTVKGQELPADSEKTERITELLEKKSEVGSEEEEEEEECLFDASAMKQMSKGREESAERFQVRQELGPLIERMLEKGIEENELAVQSALSPSSSAALAPPQRALLYLYILLKWKEASDGPEALSLSRILEGWNNSFDTEKASLIRADCENMRKEEWEARESEGRQGGSDKNGGWPTVEERAFVVSLFCEIKRLKGVPSDSSVILRILFRAVLASTDGKTRFKITKLLLLYHEPQLAVLLQLKGIQPSSYCSLMIATLFAKDEVLEGVYAMWDGLLLETQSPVVAVFGALAILITSKRMIVRYSKEGDLLGFLRKLGLGGPEATPALRRKMEELIEDTPTSFIPLLQEDYSAFRARAILQQLSTEKPLEITPFVRQCVELSAEELVTSLDTAQEHAGKRYFVVDCRPKSYFEREQVGASVHLDPAIFRFRDLESVGSLTQPLPPPIFKAFSRLEGLKGSALAVVGRGWEHDGGSEEKQIETAVLRVFYHLGFEKVALVRGGFSAIKRDAKKRGLQVISTGKENTSVSLAERRQKATLEAKRALAKASKVLSVGIGGLKSSFSRPVHTETAVDEETTEGKQKEVKQEESGTGTAEQSGPLANAFSLGGSDEEEEEEDGREETATSSAVIEQSVLSPESRGFNVKEMRQSIGSGLRSLDTFFSEGERLQSEAGVTEDAQLAVEVAHLLSTGLGLLPDNKKALLLYERGASLGSKEAFRNLGYFYSNGIAVDRCIEKAVLYYEKAAELSDPEAAANLGYLYGNVVKPPNFDKAVLFYRLASAKGIARADYQLGKCYERGLGVKRDLLEAYSHYKRAAEKGHMIAMNLLGVYFAEGDEETGGNDRMALVWFYVASRKGSKSARRNVETMKSKLSAEDVEQALKLGRELLQNIDKREEQAKAVANVSHPRIDDFLMKMRQLSQDCSLLS